MAREQKRRREAEEKGGRRRKTGSMTELATTIGVAEEATTASAGDNRACSDRGCGKNECGSDKRIGARDRTECRGSSEKGPVCYGSRQGEELLHLWGFWALGP